MISRALPIISASTRRPRYIYPGELRLLRRTTGLVLLPAPQITLDTAILSVDRRPTVWEPLGEGDIPAIILQPISCSISVHVNSVFLKIESPATFAAHRTAIHPFHKATPRMQT